MSKRDLAEVLFKVIGVIGLFLIIESVPMMYTILTASVDPSLNIGRAAYIINLSVNTTIKLIIYLVLLFFGGNISNKLFSASTSEDKLGIMFVPNRDNFIFWIKLTGIFIIFYALPPLTKNVVDIFMLDNGYRYFELSYNANSNFFGPDSLWFNIDFRKQ